MVNKCNKKTDNPDTTGYPFLYGLWCSNHIHTGLFIREKEAGTDALNDCIISRIYTSNATYRHQLCQRELRLVDKIFFIGSFSSQFKLSSF